MSNPIVRAAIVSTVLALGAFAIGCGGARSFVIMPSTSAGAAVQEARVSVNGQFVGSGSVEVRRERSMVVTVDASPQYEPAQVQVTQPRSS
jgi:type IV pilus biogenesis protein CpaD/CtpE